VSLFKKVCGYPSLGTYRRPCRFALAVLLLAVIPALTFGAVPPPERQTELAGNFLADYPYFEYVKAFNVDAPVRVAIDPFRFPGVVGLTADIYLVVAKDAGQWASSPGLTDVAGGPLTVTFSGASIQANRWLVAAANTLNADAGTGLGVGYDIVLDMNQNGQLDDPDYIDGLGEEAGLYMVHDTTQPGPLAVTEIIYSGGSWLGQDTYYPTNISSMGLLPLVVISHGNGHNYQWYDHIGYHLASYGYIVMAHENNTSPGIETASTTTLTNTDYIIANQGSIGGGVLSGHIDSHAITWIGHSRGAEGITRAYDRIVDGYTPGNFIIEDVRLLSSMLPTDFLKTASSNPHGANYHLWTAAGDSDVNGSASCDLCQTFHLHDRATGYRQSTVVQGTGHAWFHDGGGTSWFTGPCSIGEAITHQIQLGYFLPLIKHYINGNIPARDFLWRQYEKFSPIGVDTTNTCVVVTHEYRNGGDSGNFFIDDFQSEPSTSTSSSGGAVTYTVDNLSEGRLDDNNTSFTWTSSDAFNGATQASSEGSDDSAGVVFNWTGSDRYIEWGIVAAQQDFSDDLYISFRGAQGTQHPNTLAVMGDLDFSVTLRDGSGTSSSINVAAYGGGLEQPYDRSGGWHNEMEVVRIRLTDFLNNNTGLDLTDIAAVRFDCGPSWGANEGRVVVDELMLTNDAAPSNPGSISITLPDGAPVLLAPGSPTTFSVLIVASNESYVPGSGTLHFRYDGGAWQTSALVPAGGDFFDATLPAPDCTDTPQFYISAEGDVTGLITSPGGAPGVYYTAEVGELTAFFTADMATNPGWSTEGLWAWGAPSGGGGQYGNPDPTSGYTGSSVYGYNLSGDYENSLPERHLTTPAIDCSGRNGVTLSFRRWLGVEQPAYDHAYLRISTNGSSWTNLWTNAGEVADGSWQLEEYDLSAYADNQATVYLRWTMGTTDGSWQYCGWNIDDVVLSAFSCDPGVITDTVSVSLDAMPDTGTLPFTSQFIARLTNLTTQNRRAAGRIDVMLANGSSYSNWRAGWTNLDPSEIFTQVWNQTFPGLAALVGSNIFTITGTDVTPAPYNQPPYAAAGDTATDVVTVTGVSP
jgi:hypothetical protein